MECNVDMLTRSEYALTTGISPTEQIYLEQGFDKFYAMFDLELPNYCSPKDAVQGTDHIMIPSDIVKPDEAMTAIQALKIDIRDLNISAKRRYKFLGQLME